MAIPIAALSQFYDKNTPIVIPILEQRLVKQAKNAEWCSKAMLVQLTAAFNAFNEKIVVVQLFNFLIGLKLSKTPPAVLFL